MDLLINVNNSKITCSVSWHTFLVWNGTRDWNKMQNLVHLPPLFAHNIVPFGVTYEKIGTIQRRLAWPLHKDDTLSRSGRSTDLNIYFILNIYSDNYPFFEQIKTLNHNTRLSQRVFLRLSVGLKLIIYATNAWGIIN